MPLVNIKKLYILGTSQIEDVDSVISTLKNLEFIHFVREFMVNILRFIKCLPRLGKLEIQFFVNESHLFFQNNVLDLPSINDERAQLANACKLTMFVSENVYLATKNSLNQTNFYFIEIKRLKSNVKIHDFVATPAGSLVAWTRAKPPCMIF